MSVARSLRGLFAIVVACVGGLTGLALLGVVFRGHFAVGTAFTAARWPSVALALVLAVAIGRAEWEARRALWAALAITLVIHGGDALVERWRSPSPLRAFDEGAPHTVWLSANLKNIPNRPESTIDALAHANADVMVIQEVTNDWRRRLEARFAADFPHRVYWPHEGTHGYAILSRWPLAEPELLYGGRALPFAQATIITIRGRDLHLVNLHLLSPSGPLRNERHRLYSALGENAATRRRQWREIQGYLRDHPRRLPSLLVGDFNTLEFEPLHAEMTKAHIDTLRHSSWGLGWTWPVNRSDLPFPIARIDYILTSPQLAIGSVEGLKTGGADHHMVRAVVQ